MSKCETCKQFRLIGDDVGWCQLGVAQRGYDPPLKVRTSEGLIAETHTVRKCFGCVWHAEKDIRELK